MESFGGYARHAYIRQVLAAVDNRSTVRSRRTRDTMQDENDSVLTNSDLTRETRDYSQTGRDGLQKTNRNMEQKDTFSSNTDGYSSQNVSGNVTQSDRNFTHDDRDPQNADRNDLPIRGQRNVILEERDDIFLKEQGPSRRQPLPDDISAWDSDHNDMPVTRKISLAKALSKSIVTGTLQAYHSRPHFDKGLSQMKGTGNSMMKDFLGTNTQKADRRNQQKKNVRASMNFLTLLIHDFKIWYRRWKHKHWELPLLKKYIERIESNFGSGLGSLFVFNRWVLCLNCGLSLLWLALVILPTAITFNYHQVTVEFNFKNLLDGRGAVGQSWLFFGKYQEKVGTHYWLSVAYLILLLITYFGSLMLIMRSIGEASQPKLASQSRSHNKFSLLLFTSWDHSITNEEASSNMVQGIASIFKDNLYEVKASNAERNRSVKEKRGIYCMRVLAWFITILLVGGGCTLIVFLVIYNVSSIIKQQGSVGLSEDSIVVVYSTPIIFTLINILVPMCIKLLPKMEDYRSGRMELYITLARIFFLRMANLFALLISLYTNIDSHIEGGGCLGTVIGQEVYKLVVVDTIIHVIVSAASMLLPYFWTRKKAEFDLSSAVLVLVYRQGLVWVGTIASPLMPLAGAISCLVFFFTNYNIVRCVCKPPLKRWNQSRNTRFLMGFLLITLAAVILPMSVVIGSRDLIHLGQTSSPFRYCGPFSGGRPTDAYRRFVSELDNWPGQVLKWLGSDIVTIPLVLIIIATLSYQRKLLSGEKHYRVLLQAELQQEREDNQELIKKLQVVGIAM